MFFLLIFLFIAKKEPHPIYTPTKKARIYTLVQQNMLRSKIIAQFSYTSKTIIRIIKRALRFFWELILKQKIYFIKNIASIFKNIIKINKNNVKSFIKLNLQYKSFKKLNII